MTWCYMNILIDSENMQDTIAGKKKGKNSNDLNSKTDTETIVYEADDEEFEEQIKDRN